MVTLLVTRHFLDSSGRRDMNHMLDYHRITHTSVVSSCTPPAERFDAARAHAADAPRRAFDTGAPRLDRARHSRAATVRGLTGLSPIVPGKASAGPKLSVSSRRMWGWGDVRIVERRNVVASEDRTGRTGSMSRAGP